MTKLHYVHGSENHFFLLDVDELKDPLDDTQLSHLAQKLAQSDVLPYSDGLLVVDHSDHAECIGQMKVFNSDGSVASMCGNGLRCVGRYLAEKFNQTDFKVQTMQADLNVHVFDDIAKGVSWVGVQIAPVKFAPADLPYTNLDFDQIINEEIPEFSDHLKFTSMAVPNPHLISFVEDDNDLEEPLFNLGTYLNQPNDYYPDGVNVNFAKILGKNKIFVRTFERGVGFTNACGTGMSATSMAFAMNYPELVDVNEPIDVFNPGGKVQTKVHTEPDNRWIQLMGNATFVGYIEADEVDLLSQAIQNNLKESGEEADYLAFIDTIKQ